MPDQSTSPRLCRVCRQPLPEGSGFCVACGSYDPSAIEQKKGANALEAARRVGLAQGLKKFSQAVSGWFRWF